MSKSVHVVKAEFELLDCGIYTPDKDKPEENFPYWRVSADINGAEVSHPLTENLYKQMEKADLQYGDELELTYPVKIVKGKMRLGKVVAFKKVK